MAKPINVFVAGNDVIASEVNDNFDEVWDYIKDKFGGDGSDGALSISSGATNIDLGNAAIVVKNYTSISITGTGYLTFTNPHANGTIVVLKSQGNVTITTSATRAIDLRDFTTKATNGQGLIHGPTAPFYGTVQGQAVVSGGTNATITFGGRGIHVAGRPIGKGIPVFSGGGGADGTGAGTPGAGGKGGGGLYIECGGALNFTGTIDVSGTAGGNGSGTGSNQVSISGSGGGSNNDGVNGGYLVTTAAVGGGGGGAGSCVILTATITANSGTITKTGGAGGTGSTSGGAGGDGYSYVGLNTELV